MSLNFNLKGMFLFVMFLMLWQMLLPGGMICGNLLVLGYLVYVYYKNKLSVCDVLFAFSFVINFWYVTRLSINVNQYDYFNFFMHAVYFVENDFFVKNPISYLQNVYFQPPLWGGIAGAITKLGVLFDLGREEAFDCVRYVSLFAISGVGIIVWKFFNLFKINNKVLLWGYGVFLLMPIHTIMAGLNNNDAFVYFIMVAILYVGYDWYLKPDIKKSLKISGLLILAGMTKFSGLMVVSYLGILGLGKIIETKNKLDKKLWSEFFIIGMGGVIGFLWGILLLSINIGLVPPPSNVVFQDLRNYTLIERLFDFSGWGSVFPDVRNLIIEHNVFLSLIKTSVFGEWSWNNIYFSYVLYIGAILLALLFIVSFLGLFKYKLGKDFALNLAIVVLTMAVFISWAMFWIEYPYFCSTEFRYVVILVPVSFLWLLNWLNNKKMPMWFNYTLASFSVLFVVAKIIVYLSTI